MHHDDRNGAGRSSRRKRRGHRLSDDDIDLACHEFACELVQASFAALGEAFLNQDCLAIDVAECLKPTEKPCQMRFGFFRRPAAEKPDQRQRLLLSVCHNRPRDTACGRAKKFPPSH